MFFQVSLGRQALPTLFQYVSRCIFKQLLEEQHTVSETNTKAQPNPLSWEEENALRYVAGYICRKVQQDIQKSSLPNKEDMILLMTDLSGDELDEDRGTETWTNAIDRLWHISDDAYTVFLILEAEIRCHLKVAALKQLNDTTRTTILEAVMANEELLFQWALVSANADDSIGIDVLKRISGLYLTVRGFAFAASCLEMYKQRNKKQIQKSKALRKEVATKDSKSH